MKRFAFLRKKHIVLGRRGENFAADYLERNGFTILARNWRTEAGELDIVARKEHEIHFVEVKTLHHKEGFTPAGNLSFKQRRRNFSAGKVFLALLGSPFMTGFFDLIEIEYTQRGAFLSLKVWNDYLPSIVRQKKESEKVNVPEVPVSDGWLARFLRYLNFLPCPLCGTGNGGGTGLLCDDCKSELKFFHRERSCPGCGGNLDGVTALCSQCLANGELPLWDRVFSVFEHTGSGRKLILDLKYNKRSELARPLGKLGADILMQSGVVPDFVTAVPVHWQRLLQRGYNQSELIGRSTARYLKVPFCNVLKRVKSGSRQATLGRTARLKNLKKAFTCVSPEKVAGKRVLLIDDVFTTGSTLRSVAEQLRKAKPAALYVLTVSRRKALFKKKMN
jgi:ComF family protein